VLQRVETNRFFRVAPFPSGLSHCATRLRIPLTARAPLQTATDGQMRLGTNPVVLRHDNCFTQEADKSGQARMICWDIDQT
jgi:hypothetical protein